MRFLYGANYEARLKSIANEIPRGSKVLDVCCGDCAIFKSELKGRNEYLGIDSNPYFISGAIEKSVNVTGLDVSREDLPKSEIVIMLSSLYQFIPYHKEIVDKMLRSAEKRVIISEPVRNLASSKNPFISFIARYSVNPGSGNKKHRFNERTLIHFFKKNYGNKIEKFKYIPGQREIIVVLRPTQS